SGATAWALAQPEPALPPPAGIDSRAVTPPTDTGERGHAKHPFLQMFLLAIVASAIGIAIVLVIDWFPPAADSQAEQIDRQWDVLMIVSVPIFVLVMLVAIYSVVRFRARPGDKGDGAPIHGNTRLEVVWVTIPFLIVSSLAAYGWVVLDDIEAKKPNELKVTVRSQQFNWSFEYPDNDKVRSAQLILPKDRPVDFDIESADVIHSFWVPAFRMKQDAVPGLTTHTRVTPTRLGSYEVVCAELCGLGHSTMRQGVRVIPPAEWDRWMADERKKKTQATGGGAQ
ncbi:MAG: cytochrome c oxidase subunit II, partial [Thermoleophilaceae bacterium]